MGAYDKDLGTFASYYLTEGTLACHFDVVLDEGHSHDAFVVSLALFVIDPIGNLPLERRVARLYPPYIHGRWTSEMEMILDIQTS